MTTLHFISISHPKYYGDRSLPVLAFECISEKTKRPRMIVFCDKVNIGATMFLLYTNTWRIVIILVELFYAIQRDKNVVCVLP